MKLYSGIRDDEKLILSPRNDLDTRPEEDSKSTKAPISTATFTRKIRKVLLVNYNKWWVVGLNEFHI